MPANTNALKRIRSHLLASLEAARGDLDRARSGLAQYEAAGPEFEEVVSEYAAVRADIEGKEWALKELKENKE